jgi:hypothetical protein
VCCAILLSLRSDLLAGDFSANITLLLHLPHFDTGDLVARAKAL